MDIDKLTKNRGFIYEPPSDTDFVAGSVSGIDYEARNPKGDWTDFLPTNERQSNSTEDYMNCVTQSGHNSLETQLHALTLPQGLQNWLKGQGYMEEGHYNFNDAFSAKLCGTTRQGASFNKFWDSVRHNGLIPEKDWHHTSENLLWEKYYEPIPEALLIKGKEFLRFFEIKYEWVRAQSSNGQPISYTTTEKELKHAPLQIATATCSPWGAGIIPACNASVCHATMIYNLDDAQKFTQILDSYDPFQKKLDSTYLIPYVMKGILSVRTYEQTTDMVAYVYCLRDDVAAAFPASNKFISMIDPNYTILDWCREYGVYELPEVFIDRKLDYSKINKGRVEEASVLDPNLKKKPWLLFIINYFSELFK